MSSSSFGGCYRNVKQFQKYLTGYEINIVWKDTGNTITYPQQPTETKAKRIYLYMHNNRYDVITTMPGFLNRPYYCHACRKSYCNVVDHLCPTQCKKCRGLDCSWIDPRSCTDCKRSFKSQKCFDRHKEPIGKGESVCHKIKKCLRCKKSLRFHQIPHHLCLQSKCKTFGEIVNDKDVHYC
jgi:hypothetical protein